MIDAVKNPTYTKILDIISSSRIKTARRLVDPRNGDIYVWDAAQGTHRDAADQLQIPYDRKPGEGDILTL